MIYVPDMSNYKCFVVQGEGVIRAYKQIPTNNSTIEYRDYYINSDYIYKDNYQTFSQYTTLPVCLDDSNLTTNVFYRLDFDKILIITLIFCIFTITPAYILFKRFFRRMR